MLELSPLQLDVLLRLENRASGKREVVPSFFEIRDFVGELMLADPAHFQLVCDLIQGKTGLLLITYTSEYVDQFKRTYERAVLAEVLLLHRLEGFRYDPRENHRNLEPLVPLLQTLNLDWTEFFEAWYLSDQSVAAQRLRQFFALGARWSFLS